MAEDFLRCADWLVGSPEKHAWRFFQKEISDVKFLNFRLRISSEKKNPG